MCGQSTGEAPLLDCNANIQRFLAKRSEFETCGEIHFGFGNDFEMVSLFMLNSVQVHHAKSRLRAKHVLFIVLCLMTFFILYHDEGFFIHYESNTWRFFYPVRGKLFVHAIGGATDLMVGALQFSTRLRQRRPALHRLLGRVYLAGVLVAAPVAIFLAFTHALAIMATGTAVQASLWVLTTCIAISCGAKQEL